MCDDRTMRAAPGRAPTADHRRSIVMTAAGIVVLGGVFAPWLRSGETTRSSFDLLDIAERLGFAEDGLFGWAARVWPLVPLLVVGATVAAWAGRAVVSGCVAIVAGLYVGGVSAGVSFAPNAGLIRTEWGVPIAAVGAVWLLASGVWMLSTTLPRRAQSGQSPRSA